MTVFPGMSMLLLDDSLTKNRRWGSRSVSFVELLLCRWCRLWGISCCRNQLGSRIPLRALSCFGVLGSDSRGEKDLGRHAALLQVLKVQRRGEMIVGEQDNRFLVDTACSFFLLGT